jgi:hypothetical protein
VRALFCRIATGETSLNRNPAAIASMRLFADEANEIFQDSLKRGDAVGVRFDGKKLVLVYPEELTHNHDPGS